MTEYELLLEARRRHLVTVDQPVVMITQAPRSGGTLLLHLLDGHPGLHVVPWEYSLNVDRRKMAADTDHAWQQLHERALATWFERGFNQSHADLHQDRTRYPALIPPSFQRALYDEILAALESPSDRDVTNAYLTSFFNAWLDNQNLYAAGPKSWVVIFTPRLMSNTVKMDRVREIYPDGRIVSIVRDPLTWFSSARRWSRRAEWARPEGAMDAWCAAAEATVARKEAEPESTVVIAFDDLLTKTRETMRLLCDSLGLRIARETLTPTLNNIPIRANSSFPGGKARVSTEPLRRHETELLTDEAAYVRSRGWDIYERALALASRPQK